MVSVLLITKTQQCIIRISQLDEIYQPTMVAPPQEIPVSLGYLLVLVVENFDLK